MKTKGLKYITAAMILLLLFIAFIPECVAAEIRGFPYDTGSTVTDNVSWDFTTFSGFTFPVNKYKNFASGCGEHLYFAENGDNPSPGSSSPNATLLDEGELVYSAKQYPDKYKVYSEEDNISKVTFYYTLPMLGKTYCAIDNDATNLAKILYKKSDEDRQVLKAGETWNISGGYSLKVEEVDIDGNKCYLTLNQNGKEIDTAVIAVDGTNDEKIFTANETFGDGKEHTYFVTYVDSVFTSSQESFAILKYTWLIDKDQTIQISTGDEFGTFEVDEALSTGITMSNKNAITLNTDGETYITDSWYFKASDLDKGTNGGYIIYLAMQEAANQATTAVTETQQTAESPSAENNTVVIDMDAEGKTQEENLASQEDVNASETVNTESKVTPGFAGWVACFAFLAIVVSAKKGKN